MGILGGGVRRGRITEYHSTSSGICLPPRVAGGQRLCLDVAKAAFDGSASVSEYIVKILETGSAQENLQLGLRRDYSELVLLIPTIFLFYGLF